MASKSEIKKSIAEASQSQSNFKRAWLIRRAERVVASLVTVVAIVLQFEFVLKNPALWRDEINSVNLASVPSLSGMWRLVEFDSFPLFWTLLLRGWMTIAGGTDFGLRLFGVLGGIALLAAVWFAVLKLGRAVPLLSLALIGVNPEMIRWANSVRAWSFGAGVAIVTFALMLDASHFRRKRYLLFALLAAIVSVQCVFQNAILLAAIVGGAIVIPLVRHEVKDALIPIGIGAAAAVSIFPYLGMFRRVGQWSILVQGTFTLDDLISKASQLVSFSSVASTFLYGAVVAALLNVGLALWRFKSPREGVDPRVAIYSAVVLIASASGLIFFYLKLHYSTEPWYYIGLFALVACCAEVGIVSVARTEAARILLVISTLILLAASISPAWKALAERQTNLDKVAARVDAEAVRGDLVVLNPWFMGISFSRYHKGDAVAITLPPLEDQKVHRYDLLKQKMLLSNPISDMLSQMERVLRSGHRVWIVGSIAAPPAGQQAPALPPPPLVATAWNVAPYMHSWTLQTGAFLNAHAGEAQQVPIDLAGGRYENANLIVFKGWR